MIPLALTEHLLTAAEMAGPREMCGLLFGDYFYLASNIAPDPTQSFDMDAQEYLKACMIHDGKPWALVHSHPTGPAFLSVEDCRLIDELEKANHDLMMVIVSLTPREIRAFQKRGHVYERVWEHTE